jgi:hypothetical protein
MLSIFDSNKQKTPLEISVVFDRWGTALYCSQERPHRKKIVESRKVHTAMALALRTNFFLFTGIKKPGKFAFLYSGQLTLD